MFPCSPPNERGACVETRNSINSGLYGPAVNLVGRAEAVAKSLDSLPTWINQDFGKNRGTFGI
jgi:hypothetical protein